MGKEVDKNGFWYLPRTPISKVGVFPYLGKQISPTLEPDKVFYVFRSPEALEKSVPTWDNPPKPFIEDHTLLGNGFTPIDDRPVQGIIYSPFYENGVLYANLAIYSEDMKDKIESGKKEISLGYFCDYKQSPGIYEGQPYDYIQINLVGNHGALVDAGRCGSDIRVFDSKYSMDAMPFESLKFQYLNKNSENEIIKKESDNPNKGLDVMEKVDKREAIRKIMAIAAKPASEFEGGDREKVDTIAKLLEKSEYNKSERGSANDDAMPEILAYLKNLSDKLDKLLAAKVLDEKEEDDAKKADEDDGEKEKKTAADHAIIFASGVSIDSDEDIALKEYLN